MGTKGSNPVLMEKTTTSFYFLVNYIFIRFKSDAYSYQQIKSF